MTFRILWFFHFMSLQNDKGCLSRHLFHIYMNTDINNTHTLCTGSQSQTQHDWIFCVFSRAGETLCPWGKSNTRLAGWLYTQRPPRHLLNLPFLPWRCVNWILCVYTHHFAGNWDFSGRVPSSFVNTHTHVQQDTHDQKWKEQGVLMLIRSGKFH